MKRSSAVQHNAGKPMIGSTLAAVFKAPTYHCVMSGVDGKPEFAVTRLQSGPRPREKAPAYPTDDAFLICVALAPTAVDQWQARYNGQQVGVTRSIPFATTVLDLQCPMEMWVSGPFDYLHYYLSGAMLRRVALDHAVAVPTRLQKCLFFDEDLVVAQVTRSIMTEVVRGEPLQAMALNEIASILCAHVLQSYCTAERQPTGSGAGLQVWQRLRAEEMLRETLTRRVPIKDLAAACELSASHFSREFRKSFGTTVHRYQLGLRIARAKELLIGTRKKLSEIARLSGFCDQAALSRTFGKTEGLTVSRWRKRNAAPVK